MNYCQAGHAKHDRKVVPSIHGPFLIYDWKQYMDFKGYCMGQDDISRTIDLYGNWSMEMYRFISDVLDMSTPGGTFIDVGAHIGWFSRLALSKGFEVGAFEGVNENIELAKINAPEANFVNIWFDKNTEASQVVHVAELMKIDIEGQEQCALEYFSRSFNAGTIKNAVIEISPVFNASYPSLLKRMSGWGYDAYLLTGEKFDGGFNFEQTDLWFKKDK